MVKKLKNVKISKKKFFRQFTRYDDMSKFGWKHVSPKCFKHLIILTNLSPVKNPSTFKSSWKNDVFWPIFSLQPKFSHVWSTNVDQNFSWQESPDLPLHNPNFEFFVSLMVTKIFCFENQIHQTALFK